MYYSLCNICPLPTILCSVNFRKNKKWQGYIYILQIPSKLIERQLTNYGHITCLINFENNSVCYINYINIDHHHLQK